MSHNQSRGERTESTQYRRTGRSVCTNQQRQFSSGAPTKGGGGGGGSAAPTNHSNRSFKRYNNNAPVGNNNASVGQTNARNPSVDSINSSAPHAVGNGGHPHHPNHRLSDAPVVNTSSKAQPTDGLTQKISPATPINPPSNVSNVSSKSNAPKTPEKAPGDASKSFSLQFGSISPGVMNVMQIPARTSSAPPNLDEQKKSQAHHQTSRAAPPVPISSVTNHILPKIDAGMLEQPNNAGEAQKTFISKRDNQLSAASPMTHTQKPSLHPNIPVMTTQLSFHQQQASLQFGGLNSQIQSQTMSGTSVPVPISMSVPLGNPPVPIFVPGLPPHPMQSQGMMHQGQNLNVSAQMGPPLPSQLSSMGMNMPPQFPQQSPVKYGTPRKAVKITHPETHEELRLDNSPNLRLHPNAKSQSQPISSFPNMPLNFYTGTYNAAPLYLPNVGSVPLSSTQAPPTPQLPRLCSQVTVKPPVVSQSGKEAFAPTSSLSAGKADSSKPSTLQGGDSVFLQKETHTQGKPGPGASSGSASISSTIGARTGVAVPNSIEDKHEKPGNRGQQNQLGSLSTSASSVPSHLANTEAKPVSSGSSLVSEAKESVGTTVVASCEGSMEEKTGDASKISGTKVENSRQSKPETMSGKEQREATVPEGSKPDNHSLNTSLQSLSLESPNATVTVEDSFVREVTSSTSGVLEHAEGGGEDDVKVHLSLAAPTDSSGGLDIESPVSETGLPVDKIHTSDASLNVPHSTNSGEVSDAKYAEQESVPVSVQSLAEDALRSRTEDVYSSSSVELVRPSSSSGKDKIFSDANVAKCTVPRGKLKIRDICKKAEANGPSADLYTAYKGPDEKKENITPAEDSENFSSISEKQTYTNVPPDNVVPCQQPSKLEPDDWEDAAEISSPQLETSKNENQGDDRDDDGSTTKKYSRDFLLKFAELCNDLPHGFEVPSGIEGTLMVSSDVSRRSHPSAGRNTERSVGGSRLDRRGSGMGDEDKRNKISGPQMSGRVDMLDISNVGGLRPGQMVNYGALRNHRAPALVQYAGGILPGPIQPFGLQGGLQRNNSESDRWQRATGFQRGLMPYPLTPTQVMHKAEKKYEVGRVTDEEQAKQRQLKGVLNKLTPQNFEKLFQQVKQVNIDNVITLSGVISQIFDKALMEPTFCEMYANFCFHLAADLPELSVDNEKITFKRLLLNKCQEEFERGEREEQEANKAAEEGELKQTAEEREEKRLRIRRRMLGNIRLIGELYKKRMLTERIMHECINKLLGQSQNPDEENLEALCKLMSTIGEMIDHPKAKEFMDAYFDIMLQLSNNMKLSSRLRFMLKDSIDLRRNKWQQRRKVEGPKKIEEVHRDAAQERHAQGSRISRVPSMGNPSRRTPMEFAPRSPSMLPSTGSQVGGFRGATPQVRGYGSQDARTEERQSYENRTHSVHLPQRPLGDESITLGPQGGLAKGMAFRGQLLAHNMGSGQNGFGSMPQRPAYNQREEAIQKYMAEGLAAPIYDQSHPQEMDITCGNPDVRNTDSNFATSHPTSPRARGWQAASNMHNVSSDKVCLEKLLRDKSLVTIQEYYSAIDENEVVLCIKDLKAPSFYPSMISIWVINSFEKKDKERELLTKLLINLTKPQNGMIISKDQLMKGFESVLVELEDTVSDAPKAPEFLGRIFTKFVLENVIPLSKIGQLIYEGGENKGQLVEAGLAAEVLGSILDIIKLEKGDSVLNEIRSSSKLQLEKFRPSNTNKPLRIDKFV